MVDYKHKDGLTCPNGYHFCNHAGCYMHHEGDYPSEVPKVRKVEPNHVVEQFDMMFTLHRVCKFFNSKNASCDTVYDVCPFFNFCITKHWGQSTCQSKK